MKESGVLLRKEKPFNPQMTIVVYTNGVDHYLESHKVMYKGRKIIFGPGIPMMEETLANVIGSISKEFLQFHDQIEFFPENILLNCQIPGKMNIIWFLIKPKRKLIFRNIFKFKTDKEIQLPNMIFNWFERSLSVFCFDGQKRPGWKTQLYKVPLPNINPNGLVCLGNAKVDTETKSLKQFIQSVEQAFFLSDFNQGGTGSIEGDFTKVWRETYKTGIFPKTALVKSPLNMTSLMLGTRQ